MFSVTGSLPDGAELLGVVPATVWTHAWWRVNIAS